MPAQLDASYLKYVTAPVQQNTLALPCQPVDQNGIAQAFSGATFTLFPLATRIVAVAGQAGTPISYLGKWKRMIIVHNITAMGGAVGDTLDGYVDFSLDNVTWYNAVHFTQIAGNGAARTEFATLDTTTPGAVVINVTTDAASGVTRPALFGAWMRGRYTLVDAGAHGQSATFSITGYGI